MIMRHGRCGISHVVVSPIARGAAALLLLTPGVVTATGQDPFSWLRPAISIDAAALGRLDRGEVVVRVLPATDGELAVFAAARVNADPDTFAAWMNAIGELKKSRFVLGMRRLSDPPAFEDLQGLSLDDEDLNDLRSCRAGDCNVKLTTEDMETLRHAADVGGQEWKTAVQEEFRRVVWNRILAYRTTGFTGLTPYADRRRMVEPNRALGALLDRSPYLQSSGFVHADVSSFFYWSKEQYGAGKAVIGVTHVEIVRSRQAGPMRVAAVSREVFATHYRNASLGLTAMTEDTSGQRYLIYVNRSQLDLLGGIFGAWKRSVLEGRLKSESAGVFSEIRRRIESGSPPE
jgi:hypothetical protein